MTDSAELKALKCSRAGAQSWVSRTQNSLDVLISTDGVEREEIEDVIVDLDKRIEKFEEVERKIECYISDPVEMENEVGQAADVIDKAKAVRRKAIKLVAAMSSSHGSSASQDQMRLPKLELQSFSGSRGTWLEFWESFDAAVNSKQMPKVNKFTYLKSLIKGEAARVIEGLALSGEHYEVAIGLLKQRYGRENQLIFEHIQSLLELEKVDESGDILRKLMALRDSITIHIRSLEKLKVTNDQYGKFLTPLILTKLPKSICLEWARDCVDKEGDLEYLMKFLDSETQRLERCEMFDESEPSTFPPAAVAQFSTQSDKLKQKCVLHEKANHYTDQCLKFRGMSIDERHKLVKELNLCNACLRQGHKGFQCRRPYPCSYCGQKHSKFLCYRSDKCTEQSESSRDFRKDGESMERRKGEEKNHSVLYASAEPDVTVLPTAKVTVRSKQGKQFTYTLLMDSGSDKTYVSEKVIEQCKPAWKKSEQNSFSSFGGKKSTSIVRNIFELELVEAHGLKFQAMEIEKICPLLKRIPVPKSTLENVSLEWADNYTVNSEFEIDILVGMDNYWNFVDSTAEPRQIHEGLVAQKTKLGRWILSGRVPDPHQHTCQNFSTVLISIDGPLVNISDLPADRVENFWNLKGIGIDENEDNVDPVLEEFERTVQYDSENKRYVVHLPLRMDKAHKLEYSIDMALKHLERLNSKLKKIPGAAERLQDYFSALESEDIITLVDVDESSLDTLVMYLPQQVVIREDNETTKVRPVIMAHLKDRNGLSINDCVESGPNLLPRLEPIMIRMRRWAVALVGDVTKAFLKVGVVDSQQDLLRFLMVKDDEIQTYKYTRVPFGLRCSPFLLNATVRHHLAQQDQDSRVVQELKDNLYVDDWITGANSQAEATQMYKEASNIMSEAGMTLAKWSSNRNEIFEKEIPPNDYAKVLGLTWDLVTDSFIFRGYSPELPIELVEVSKRVILSALARLYDPIGFLCPFEIEGKLIFQECWRRNLSWNSSVEPDIRQRFQEWINGLALIEKELKIPRHFGKGQQIDWNVDTVELRAYADASTKAYGCVIYLLMKVGDNVLWSLVLSKGRVAPMKQMTLPKLELLGCKLAAEGLNFVCNALKLPHDVSYKCYTDSMISLHWITGDTDHLKGFVKNRVLEIKKVTTTSAWKFIEGVKNPADILTRGIRASELVTGPRSDLWFQGPREDFEHQLDISSETQLLSVETEVDQTTTMDNTFVEVFQITRWSSWMKALRVTASVLRFIENCKLSREKRAEERKTGDLSHSEIRNAQTVLLKHEQRRYFSDEIARLKMDRSISRGSKLLSLRPFLASDGLLRKSTRLDETQLNFDSKYPVILQGHIGKLLISFIHKLFCHAGVQTIITTLKNVYWIIGLRCAAKKVKKACIQCQIQDSRPYNEQPAPLPRVRVTKSTVFETTGVDFAGPLFCIDFPGKKFYLVLFTCATIRAIHLELVDTLSFDDFVMAFRRMASRRALPKIIYSDNAKTFEKTHKALKDYFGSLAPEWRFIAPLSPWWGAWYERLIRTVKSALRKTLGNKTLTRTELETSLTEVMALVNSRPLTFVGDSPDSPKALTPNDFLLGTVSGFDAPAVENPPNITSELLSDREQYRLRYLDLCWKTWSAEYIKDLPVCVSGFKKRGTINVGQLVLIRDDQICKLPRLKWPIGLVVKLHVGKDGLARAADLKTKSGLLTRDIRRLYNLELQSTEYDSEVPKSDRVSETNDNDLNLDVCNGSQAPDIHDSGKNYQSDSPIRTRYGRSVKAPQKLDL